MKRLTSIAKDFASKFKNTKNYRVQVGLFDSQRYQIGVMHEFGSFTNKLPKRSFLKMPLERFKTTILAPVANKKGILDMKAIANNIGTNALIIVNEAFKTKGFGDWRALTLTTKIYKDKYYPASADLILVQTGELRQSIVFKIIS